MGMILNTPVAICLVPVLDFVKCAFFFLENIILHKAVSYLFILKHSTLHEF
jgi:hypothetical protein